MKMDQFKKDFARLSAAEIAREPDGYSEDDYRLLLTYKPKRSGIPEIRTFHLSASDFEAFKRLRPHASRVIETSEELCETLVSLIAAMRRGMPMQQIDALLKVFASFTDRHRNVQIIGFNDPTKSPRIIDQWDSQSHRCLVKSLYAIRKQTVRPRKLRGGRARGLVDSVATN